MRFPRDAILPQGDWGSIATISQRFVEHYYCMCFLTGALPSDDSKGCKNIFKINILLWLINLSLCFVACGRWILVGLLFVLFYLLFVLEKQMWNQNIPIRIGSNLRHQASGSASLDHLPLTEPGSTLMTKPSIPGLGSIFSKTPLPKLQRNTPCPPFCLSLGFLGKRLSLSLVFDDLETSVFIAFAYGWDFLCF